LNPKRLAKFYRGPELRVAEQEVLVQVLHNRERALAWNFKKIRQGQNPKMSNRRTEGMQEMHEI
jgi:hypothetical protein